MVKYKYILKMLLVVSLTCFLAACTGETAALKQPKTNDQYCEQGFCIRLGQVYEQQTGSIQYTLVFTRTDLNQTRNLQLLEGLDSQLDHQFRFGFHNFVKLITKTDTLQATFSHLESNGNISGETTQLVGFDMPDKPTRGDQITFNDIFFTRKVYAFEL